MMNVPKLVLVMPLILLLLVGAVSAGSVAVATGAQSATAVTSTTANGAYTTGTNIDIQVKFVKPSDGNSRSVTVTGTPRIQLNVGPTTRYANYFSGSTTSTLTFRYTVQAGDTSADLDYASTGALTLNGGTITNGGDDATLTLPTPGATGSLGLNKNIVIDTTAPAITVTNPNTSPAQSKTVSASTNEGTLSYVKVAGATTCDGSQTYAVYSGAIVLTSESDNTKKICFKAIDTAGNTAYTASNAIAGIDTTAPTASSVDSDAQTYNLATSSPHTIKVTFSENIANTPTISVGGAQTVTNCGDAKTFCFAYTIPAATQSTTKTITISGAQDSAGNTMSADSAHTFIVDTVAPVITITNPDTSPAQSKTLTALTSEGTLTMSVTTGSICDGTLSFVGYSSTTFISEADNGKKICYKAVDTAGNAAYSMSNAIAGIDTTAPTLTETNPVSTPTKVTSPEYGFTSNEAGTISYGGSCASPTTSASAGLNTITFNTLPDGTYSTCTVTVTDAAGNPSNTLTVSSFMVDTTAPTTSDELTGTTYNGNGWYASAVTVKLVPTDGTGSGVASTQYKVDSGDWTTYAGTFPVSGDGPHAVQFYSTDSLGNVESTNTQNFKIDSTPPAGTGVALTGTRLGDNLWYISNVDVAIIPGTDATSGVASTQYNLDSGGWTNYASAPFPETTPFGGTLVTISADGAHAVNYRSIDVAGNTETPGGTKDWNMDQVKPSTNAEITSGTPGLNGWYTSPVTVTLTPSDAAPSSGIASTQYSVNGGNWQTGTAVSLSADGVYAISFHSTDNAGNTQSSDGTQSVNIDQTAPSAVAVHIASNNDNGPTLAKAGDVITVSFTTNEALSATPTTTVDGNEAVVSSIGDNSYTATYTMTDAQADGAVSFDVNFADVAGNAGSASATTDESAVTFDKTTPTLGPVHIASNNADTSEAKVGDTVTLSFTAGEPISTPTATINTNPVEVISLGENAYQATYTLGSEDTEGVMTFDIGGFSDAAGNAGSTVTGTTDESSVTFDRTPPVISEVSIASNNANSNQLAKVGDIVTVSFSSSEPLSEGTTATIDGNAATVSNTGENSYKATYTMTGVNEGETEGLVSFAVDFSDLAGNAGTETTTVNDDSSVTFDKTAPSVTGLTVTPNSTNGETTYVSGASTISAAVSDGEGSGLKEGSCQYSLNGESWSEGASPIIDGRCTFSEVNTAEASSISVRVSDNVGNLGSTSSPVSPDTSGPSVTGLAITPSYNTEGGLFVSGNSTISAALSDGEIGSGVAYCQYTLNANDDSPTWVNASNTSNSTNCTASNVDTSEATSIAMRAIDNVGNVGTGDAKTVIPDNFVPQVGDVTITRSRLSGEVLFVDQVTTLRASVNDDTDGDNDGGSGIASCQYTLDGGTTWTNGVYDSEDGCTASNVDTSGASSIAMRATDNAGNVGTGNSESVTPAIIYDVGDGNEATDSDGFNISNGTVNVTGPANVTINGTNWDGVLRQPSVLTGAFTVDGGTVDVVVFAGSPTPITFSAPVKIVISGQAGKKAGWAQNGITTLTPIATVCNSATAPTNVPANGECYVDSGPDLAIWTYHFTTFGSFTPTPPPAPPSNGGGGGGTGGGEVSGNSYYFPGTVNRVTVQPAPTPAPTPAPAPAPQSAPAVVTPAAPPKPTPAPSPAPSRAAAASLPVPPLSTAAALTANTTANPLASFISKYAGLIALLVGVLLVIGIAALLVLSRQGKKGLKKV